MKSQLTKKKSQRVVIIFTILIVLATGALLYYSSRSLFHSLKEQTPKITITHEGNMDTVKTIIITGTNYSFTPKFTTLNKGNVIKLILKITHGTHNLNIDAFNVHTLPLTNSQETVQFTASKIGNYEFYSSVGNDKSKGMTGNLVVQ